MNKEELANLKYEICRKYGEFGLSSHKVPSKVWENLIDNEIGLINQLTELKADNERLKIEVSYEKERKDNAFKLVRELQQQLKEKDEEIEKLREELKKEKRQ